jgi:aspartate kinase
MALIVQKFGGTSVGTPERIRSVAERIARSHSQGHQLVVVVSAMGHATDELIDLAHKVSKNPSHREMDMLLTVGERISMALLSMALSECKVPALSLTGSQSGIITDGSHRRARIRRILGDRVRGALNEGKVVIVAGFQGVSETKEITTLGRGGSDTTAVALAATLRADVCEIYTDVDGVYSADPRIVPGARFWKKIRSDLMVEMATRGAGVLHPRSVELAKQFKMPLKVLNSLNDHEGTTVMPELKAELRPELRMEEFRITGVTADRTKLLIRVELSRPTVLGALWERAEQTHLSVLTPSFSQGHVWFFSDREGEQEWKKHLDYLSREGFVTTYELDSTTIPLSIVGDRFSQDGAALSRVMEVLGRNKVPVLMGSASPLAITVGIPLNFSNEGVQALHEEFLEKGKA